MPPSVSTRFAPSTTRFEKLFLQLDKGGQASLSLFNGPRVAGQVIRINSRSCLDLTVLMIGTARGRRVTSSPAIRLKIKIKKNDASIPGVVASVARRYLVRILTGLIVSRPILPNPQTLTFPVQALLLGSLGCDERKDGRMKPCRQVDREPGRVGCLKEQCVTREGSRSKYVAFSDFGFVCCTFGARE